MAEADRNAFLRAARNIAKWGDTDVFPFPVENHVFHDKSPQIADICAETFSNFNESMTATPVISYSTLAPVGYTGFRWATQIDPAWNAYLLGLVVRLAPAIEEARISDDDGHIYSYRYRDDSEDSLFGDAAWSKFQEATRSRAEESGYVVSVDIADFYSRIYHHRLENALRAVDEGGMYTKQIMEILRELSGNTSYGLPVGGPAARILAELVLNRVDRLLLAEPSTRSFCRYADDYRFFVKDMPTAYRAVGYLSEKLLRNEGLSLQKSKTRIMTSAEYLSVLDPVDPPAGTAAKFLGLHVHYDPYSPTAEEDYERLKDQIDEFDILSLLHAELDKGRVHSGLTRRLIGAFRFLDPVPRQQAAYSLLDNIDVLAPVAPQALMAVRSALDDLQNDEFTAEIHQRVRNFVQQSHFMTRVDLNLSYMIRVLASKYSVENEDLLLGLYASPHGFGSGPSVLVQRDIMLTLAKWRLNYWLSDQKNYASTMHPWIRRAFIISSYTLDDEGKHWRDNNKASFSKFDIVLRDWAAGRAGTPGQGVPI